MQPIQHLERPRTLNEFQQMFSHIYGELNQMKYSDDELVRRLMEEIAKAMEIARKDRRDLFVIQLPRIFSWYNAVANALEFDLQEVLWNKYPGVCSYCMRPKDCECGTEHPSIQNKEDILRRLRRDRSNMPVMLRDHQLLHARLYAWQNERIFPIQTAAHLAEEAGEVSAAHRHGDRDELAGELADVASWLFGLATRLNIDFEDTVWVRYPYECEKCHRSVCDGDHSEED